MSSPDPLSKTRETARQEIPDPLRRDVRLLGDLLGRVIADYGGAKLLRDVQAIELRHVHVEEYQVRLQISDFLEGFSTVLGFADNRDLRE